MAKKKDKPKVHEDLKGLNMTINSFGELSSSMDIDKINQFLNAKLEDRKLTTKEESTDKKD